MWSFSLYLMVPLAPGRCLLSRRNLRLGREVAEGYRMRKGIFGWLNCVSCITRYKNSWKVRSNVRTHHYNHLCRAKNRLRYITIHHERLVCLMFRFCCRIRRETSAECGFCDTRWHLSPCFLDMFAHGRPTFRVWFAIWSKIRRGRESERERESDARVWTWG